MQVIGDRQQHARCAHLLFYELQGLVHVRHTFEDEGVADDVGESIPGRMLIKTGP